MLRFLIFLAVLFGIALGFHWLNNASGEVSLTIGDTAYAVNLTTAVIGLVVTVLVAMALIWFARGILRSPFRMARGWRRRNRARGREAISQGLIAIAAGDLRMAERATTEAARRAPEQPLTLLLRAQNAQLRGDRVAARQIFQAMTEERATRIAGLRGLYIEAEREGENEAARQIAEKAREEAPTAPWAARALLRHQTVAADWDGALRTLSGAADGRILDKRTARRQRAVILAAKALDLEDGEPDAARQAALEAHDLAPELVPAATVAGRLLARQGDVRRATRVLEAAWKAAPHPEVADAYVHVRTGDAASDRLQRAETLFRMRPHADEGRHAIAIAAIDAREFSRAREILQPLLNARPTRKALVLMAEVEEAETGDRGRAREWLARAVNAPRDPAWTADGIVLEAWAPASPVTGKIDAVEWKVPLAELPPPAVMETSELPRLLAHAPVEDAEETGPTAPGGVPTPAAGAAGHEMPSKPPRPQDTSPNRGETSAAGATPVARKENAQAPPEAPVRPLVPDDPGVGGDVLDDEEERRYRAF